MNQRAARARPTRAGSSRRGSSHRPRLEPLEQRRLLDGQGLLAGSVFHDVDRDGVRDADEVGLAGFEVELQPIAANSTPRTIFENPTPDNYSQFGRFLAAADNRIAVSAHYDDVAGPAESGAVYVFDATTSELSRVITKPDPRERDRFGRALAIRDDVILIGAPLDDSAAEDGGAVYLFDLDTGELLRRLVNPAPRPNDQFGRSIAVIGDKVLIGARFDDRAGTDAGAAFLFDLDNGQPLHSLVSPRPAPGAQFGYYVDSTDDGNILIGARYDENGDAGKGVVYMFDTRSGSLLENFENPTQTATGERTGFASTLTAVGDNLLVGARRDDFEVSGGGAAFLFSMSDGELLHTFTSPSPWVDEEFGFHVSKLDGDLLIGARWDNLDGPLTGRTGAAYLFDGDTGRLLQTYGNPVPGATDAFGISVGTLGGRVIVGTRDGNAVYLFDPFVGSRADATDGDAGAFRFDELAAGTYRVVVTDRPGFAATSVGDVDFTVTIDGDDEIGNLDFGVVPNVPPAAEGDVYTVWEDSELIVSAPEGVLSNDVDVDADAMRATVVTPPTYGMLDLRPDGSFTYRPHPDFSGVDSFTYRAGDGLTRSNLATALLDVRPINDVPVATDNRLLMLANTTRAVEPGVLNNDIDVDGDDLVVSLAQPPVHGQVELLADGTYTYTPARDYVGDDSFAYTVSDGAGGVDQANVKITVTLFPDDRLIDDLRITEVNYHPHASADGECGGIPGRQGSCEFIEVTNRGNGPIDLDGVLLTGAVQLEIFEKTVLNPGDYGVFVGNVTAFQSRYGTDRRILGQYQGDLHNSGERIQVSDPYERTIMDFSYDDEEGWPIGADGFGASLEVIATAGDYNLYSNWRASAEYGGSPGLAGGPTAGSVVINEVLTYAGGTLPDAIELFNLTELPVDIGGWFLSDSAARLDKYEIPADTVIPAGEYLVFNEFHFNSGSDGFSFNGSVGGSVWLTAGDGEGNLTRFVDFVRFGPSLPGESFSRWPDGTGDLLPVEFVTLGDENSGPRVGPILINEISYHPPTADDAESRRLEFVEIHNPTGFAVDLRGWRIRGGISFDFPEIRHDEPVWLDADESIVVVPFAPDGPRRDAVALAELRRYYSIAEGVRLFGPFDGSLDNDGDSVRLLRAEHPDPLSPHVVPLVVEDEVTYDDEDPWPLTADGLGDSLNRRGAGSWGNDPASWIPASPSPGSVDRQAGLLAVSELNYHPPAPTDAEWVVAPGLTSDDFEFIELLNVTDVEIDLSGMELVGGVEFLFPDAVMAPGERAVVVANALAMQARHGGGIRVLGQYSGDLDDSGDSLTLVSRFGYPVWSLTYDDQAPWPRRAAGQGSSLELPDITNNYSLGGSWRASEQFGGSPGRGDARADSPVVINEYVGHAQPPHSPYVELVNVSDQPVDVGGWLLSDTESEYRRFEILPGTVLDPGEHVALDPDLLISLGQDEFPRPAPGGDLYLLETDSAGEPIRFADQVSYGGHGVGESWGRFPDGDGIFAPLSLPTFGAANGVPRIGPLIISEVMYHPRERDDETKEEDLEYVEIHNPHAVPFDLAQWRLDGAIRYEFGEGTVLSPRETLIVVGFDPDDTRAMTALRQHYDIKPWVDVVGHYVGNLTNDQATIRLVGPGDPQDPDPSSNPPVLADEVRYRDDVPWPIAADGLGYSLVRRRHDGWGNDPDSWAGDRPSPGTVSSSTPELVITEFNYHPHGPTLAELAIDDRLTADDFEFIELLNVSGRPLDLAGMHFAEGIDFTLPDLTLAPAGRILVVANLSAFLWRYDVDEQRIAGQYDGDLDDRGETITVLRGSEVVLSVGYEYTQYWADRADGRGSSLELFDLLGEYSDPDNWLPSVSFGGSPGFALPEPRTDVVINEVLPRPVEGPETIELFNTTDEVIDIGGWYLGNDHDDFRKFRIPEGTTIDPGGFVVFHEQDFGTVGGFRLDDRGDRVWLVEADANDRLTRFVDTIEYGEAGAGRSFGRWPDGQHEMRPLVESTFGGPNSEALSSSLIVVSEVHAHPHPPSVAELAADPSFRAEDFQFIELRNVSEAYGHPTDYALSGLLFNNGIRFNFHDSEIGYLAPGQSLVLVQNRIAFETRYGPSNAIAGEFEGLLDLEGERIELVNTYGESVVDFRYRTVDDWPRWAGGEGTSLELAQPTGVPLDLPSRTTYLEDPANWVASGRVGGTPGEEGLSWELNGVINEIDAWQSLVELANPSDEVLDDEGWFLAGRVDGARHELTESLIPGAYRVRQVPLDPDGGILWLLDEDRPGQLPRIIAAAVYEPTRAGESIGRWPDRAGRLVPMSEPTLGRANSGPRIGPVVFSEIFYNSNEPNEQDAYEFLELHNPGYEPVSLAHWRIEGGVEFQMPDLLLGPDRTLIVLSFDPMAEPEALADFVSRHQFEGDAMFVGPYDGKLSNGGERLRLMRYASDRQTWIVEDEVEYDDRPPWGILADGRGASLNRIEPNSWGDDYSSWLTVRPTPGSTDYGHAAVIGSRDLRITELMYNPTEPSEDEFSRGFTDNNDFEFIEILNVGNHAIDLFGVQLSGAVTFDFSSENVATLAPGEFVLVVRDQWAFRHRYGDELSVAGEYQGRLNNGGERLLMLDATRQVIHDFQYNDGITWPDLADGLGASLEIVDTEGDYGDPANWRNSSLYGGSPGRIVAPTADVVINEVVARSGQGGYDWIELYNASATAVDVGNWYLSDTRVDPRKFAIPAGTVIPPGGYLTFDEHDFNPTPATPGPRHFSLDGVRGTEVVLTAVDADEGQLSRFADRVYVSSQSIDQSWGRWPEGRGELFPMGSLTPGGPNAGPSVGPLVVSEIMYHPSDEAVEDGGDPLEYVEVFNATSEPVNVDGWRLTGGVQFEFDDLTLPPGGIVVVVSFDPTANVQRQVDFRAAYGIGESVPLAGPYFGRLDNAGETLDLTRPDLPAPEYPSYVPRLLTDRVRFVDQAPWPRAADGQGYSLTRVDPRSWAHDDVHWAALTPSPGSVTDLSGPPRVLSVETNRGIDDPLDLPAGAQPTSWRAQRSEIRSIVVTFSQTVTATNPDWIRLTNLGVRADGEPDTPIWLRDEQIVWDANVVTLSFERSDLPDGVYSLEVLPVIAGPDGRRLDGDGDGIPGDAYRMMGGEHNGLYRLSFDFNGDHGVSIFDFTAFTYWFGHSTDVAPSYMDLNGDQGVSIFDFIAFQDAYGTSLEFPRAASASSAVERSGIRRAAPVRRDGESRDSADPMGRSANDAALVQILADQSLDGWVLEPRRIRVHRSDRGDGLEDVATGRTDDDLFESLSLIERSRWSD